MAAGIAPGTTGLEESSEGLTHEQVRSARPGTAGVQGHAVSFDRLDVWAAARRVPLNPAHGKSVFYHGSGARAAASFVQQNPSCTRIDELLFRSVDGRTLLAWLLDGRSWSDTRDVWWELSRRLARESSGDVHVFGDGRYGAAEASPAAASLNASDQPAWKSRFAGSEQKYADTVFEKVELPELENNPRIDTIYYNGTDIDAFEKPVRTRARAR